MKPTKLLKRVNELARKSKKGELTKSEKVEQKKLRKQYLKNFRKKFSKQLDNIKIVRSND